MTKPDWGHGPNVPVLMFTEEEIRTAWSCHRAAHQGLAHGPNHVSAQASIHSLTAEQFIAVLKQGRDE